MPWKIVNLDYNASKPHLHLKDPSSPIHLRSYFTEQRVEIALGADDPEDCFVRAVITPDDVLVDATKFEPLHVQILTSILGSLDVEPGERDDALGWMQDRVRDRGAAREAGGMLRGNVDAFPPPTGWPYELTDAALLETLDDREGTPHTRINALQREAQRRGLRPAPSPQRGGGPRAAPEVIVQRPRR